MSPRHWLIITAICGALGVGLGAYGAHGLSSFLEQRFPGDAAEQSKLLDIWNTAASYHLLHAVALLATVPLMRITSRWQARLAATFFLAGIVIFSGSLYALVLSDIRILGAITFIGGLCLIIGWLTLAFVVIKQE
jgi:uncharacterized membrane protein YgdD (TMEM256/DUF423 family)